MFPRIAGSEFPFTYLLSINNGMCRLCNWNGGTIETIVDVQRLQKHYFREHPVTKNQGSWTQKISDKDGEMTIALFGSDDCIQDDCGFSRDERAKTKNNKFFVHKMRIRLVITHASFYTDEIIEEDIIENKLFLCIMHFTGHTQQMTELYSNFGIMYMFPMGMQNPKIRLKNLPVALANKIRSRRICPQVVNIQTSFSQVPTVKHKQSIIASLTEKIQKLKKMNSALKKTNLDLQQMVDNSKASCHVCEIKIEVQSNEKKARMESSIAFNQSNLINYGATKRAMANSMSMPPPIKKIKIDTTAQLTNAAAVTPIQIKKQMVRRKLTKEDCIWKCKLCDAAFGHKQSLKRHDKTMHFDQ